MISSGVALVQERDYPDRKCAVFEQLNLAKNSHQVLDQNFLLPVNCITLHLPVDFCDQNGDFCAREAAAGLQRGWLLGVLSRLVMRG